jgi:hypothetical protein
MKDLPRKARQSPWDTKACAADLGHRDYSTLNKYSFDQTRLDNYYGKGDERPIRKGTTLRKNTSSEASLQTYGSIFYPMINEKNLLQINQKRKNLKFSNKKSKKNILFLILNISLGDFTQYPTDFRST